MGEIVIFDNNFNTIDLGNLTSSEMNLLLAIMYKCKNKGTQEVEFTFSELKSSANFLSRDKKRFFRAVIEANKSLASLMINEIEPDKKNTMTQFTLFKSFRTSEEEQTLKVEVSEKFSYLLNDLTQNFTVVELQNFTEIKSKYSKTLFLHLRQYRSTGLLVLTAEEFSAFLALPKGYTSKDIAGKIISPCIEELKPYFKGLTVKTKRKKAKGSPIEKYLFVWEPESEAGPKELEEL